MAPSAAELFKQATDKRARFADGQTGVSKKRNQEITVGQLYLRSWWPYCMLKLQRMRTSKLWVCRWFFIFLNFIDQQLHMAHGCQDACCKEGYRKQIYVCVVCPVHYFPLQLLIYIAVRMNKMKEWPHWTLSGKMANQSVKTSNRQMTGFFCHDRFSPVNCVIGILRVW